VGLQWAPVPRSDSAAADGAAAWSKPPVCSRDAQGRACRRADAPGRQRTCYIGYGWHLRPESRADRAPADRSTGKIGVQAAISTV